MPTSQGCYKDEMIFFFFVKDLDQCLCTVRARQEFNIISTVGVCVHYKLSPRQRFRCMRFVERSSEEKGREEGRDRGRQHMGRTEVRMWSQLGSGCTLWDTSHTTETALPCRPGQREGQGQRGQRFAYSTQCLATECPEWQGGWNLPAEVKSICQSQF